MNLSRSNVSRSHLNKGHRLVSPIGLTDKHAQSVAQISRCCMNEQVVLVIRAVISVEVSILFWVGCSGILTGEDLFPNSRKRELLYLLVGVILLVATDTLRGNAGLPGGNAVKKLIINQNRSVNTLAPLLKRAQRSKYIKWVALPVRVILALIGQQLVWTSLFNLFDLYTWKLGVAKDTSFLLIGLAGLIATNTLYDMAMIYPPDFKRSWWHSIAKEDKIHVKIVSNAMAFVSILFQNLIWVASWDLMLFYAEETWWRDLIYNDLGLLVMAATDCLIAVALITEDSMQPKGFKEPRLKGWERFKSRLLSMPHVLLGLAGQLFQANGLWSLADYHILPEISWPRYLVFILIALIVLWLDGVLVPSAMIEVTHDKHKELISQSQRSRIEIEL